MQKERNNKNKYIGSDRKPREERKTKKYIRKRRNNI